jgi:hypothetical protein
MVFPQEISPYGRNDNKVEMTTRCFGDFSSLPTVVSLEMTTTTTSPQSIFTTTERERIISEGIGATTEGIGATTTPIGAMSSAIVRRRKQYLLRHCIKVAQ